MQVEASGANVVNWEALLSSLNLGKVEKTTGTDGKEVFTITMQVGDETKTATITAPDLELPETVDEAAFQSLVSKLEGLGLDLSAEQIGQMKDSIMQAYREVSEALGDVAASSKGSVLFDIYALMSLMIEVAQSQRDAARDMRTAQNQAIQKSIQDQADKQREAAMIGMIIGLVCGGLSALASIGMMIGQGVTAKAQSQIMSQSGADASKMHSSMLQNTDTVEHAQTQLDQTTAKVGPEVAQRVNNDFDAQLVDDQAGNLRTNLDGAIEAHTTAKNEATENRAQLRQAREQLTGLEATKNQKQEAYDAKTNTVTEKETALRQLEQDEHANPEAVNAARAELETARAEQTTARSELDTAKQNYDTKNEEVTNLQSRQTELDSALTRAEGNLTKAKADYSKTVQDVAAQYQEKYQTAVDRLSNPPEGADKAQLQTDVKNARTEMEMAFAKEAQLLSQDGVMTPSEQKDLVAAARTKANLTMDRVYQRTDFKAAERKMSTLMGINNINQAIGGMLQSMAQSVSTMEAAKATKQGAETQKQEEMLDQTKDLFQQEQKLIDAVIQLLQAVLQAEVQSMRDAIQA